MAKETQPKRTMDQMAFEDAANVKFGYDETRIYEVNPLSMLKSRAWQKELFSIQEKLVNPLADMQFDAQNAKDSVQAVLERVKETITSAPESILDLLCSYCQAIKDDREWIMENGSTVQAWNALKEVIAIEFPFLTGAGAAVKMLTTAPNGKTGKP